jgi:8-oxo-dGTP pyrophosphatase MutT (NUDIX family)
MPLAPLTGVFQFWLRNCPPLHKADARNEWGFPGGALEIGESAEEAVIREVQEEAGLSVKVDSLIEVYTKYFDVYSNGDKAQTMLFFFQCSVVGGNLNVDREETFDLAFFDPHNAPEPFNQQHRDMLSDYMSQRRGVFR